MKDGVAVHFEDVVDSTDTKALAKGQNSVCDLYFLWASCCLIFSVGRVGRMWVGQYQHWVTWEPVVRQIFGACRAPSAPMSFSGHPS